MRLSDQTLVVAVTYRAAWRDCPVAASLERAGAPLATLLARNGTLPDESPPPVEILRGDGTNPGVGPRYLEAAREAAERGDAWMLLLDADFEAPDGWWSRYEAAVSSQPGCEAYAPEWRAGKRRISPFVQRRGIPRPATPLASAELPARGHVAINSGLLVRTECVLGAWRGLQDAPLDFSDYLLSDHLARREARFGRIELDLEHDLSSLRPASSLQRLERFDWFCRGARTWADSAPERRVPVRLWALSRALKLAFRGTGLASMMTWKRHLTGPPEARP